MTHVIIELQTDAEGAVATVTSTYDSEAQAVSKFHTVMAAAALSDVPCHAVVHMLADGGFVGSGCFHHEGDADA